MKRVLRAVFMVLVLSLAESVTAQTAADCCYNCTCAYCSEFPTCAFAESPHDTPEGCLPGGTNTCGVTLPCESYWENNTLGVTSDQPGGPGGCIPIDGGLGFLIAGGLGIGVLGIRRRKEELELERG